MPPIRRYLRVTRYTVLEVRIHLDDPAQLSWLTKTADPALPRIIAAIRPLVLPKLREESERAKGKSASAKKRNVKDTVTKPDFEVSMFLTDSSTRHQLLTKTKDFLPSKGDGTLKSWVGNGSEAKQDNADDVIMIRQESPDDDVMLANVPAAPRSAPIVKDPADDTATGEVIATDRVGNDDKKMAPRTTYDGFSIYGRVLCLLVKRRSTGPAKAAAKRATTGGEMMENWVSTQAAQMESAGLPEAG